MNQKRDRPLGIVALAVLKIVFGIWIIVAQLQILRNMPVPTFDVLESEDIVINIKLISSVSAACLGFIPLTLGLGLWNLLSWARVISICLYGAIMVPSFAAALRLIPDPNTTREVNTYVGIVCAIALWILLSPKVVKAFSPRRKIKT